LDNTLLCAVFLENYRSSQIFFDYFLPWLKSYVYVLTRIVCYLDKTAFACV
jgi:hypothetical protein